MRPFFFPRAIAVVGVSQDAGKFGSRFLKALKRFGFSGRLYPVGHKAATFEGLQIYTSIADLPEDVDLVYICLPAPMVPDTVVECRRRNIPAVVVFSAGFNDSGTIGGRRLEAELDRLSGHGLRILGPNCFGIYSPGGGVTMIPGPNFSRESGPLGLLSQSGGISAEICRQSGCYGLRLSQAVSYGNACDIAELDLLQYFETDPNTRIISAYIEGVRRGKEFFKIIKRLALKKPVIIWKGGVTPSGAHAAASHTASLAGDERIWSAIFRQTAAIQVHSIEALLDTASALTFLPPQTDQRVAFVCGGGGFGVAASDICYREGLSIPVFAPEVRKRLAAILAPNGTSADNPVDTGSPFPPTGMLHDILEVLASSGNVGNIVIQTSFSPKMHMIQDGLDEVDREAERGLKEVPVKIRDKWGIPVIVVIREGGGDETGGPSWETERRRLRRYYHEQGIAVYPTVERAFQALGRLVTYYRRKESA